MQKLWGAGVLSIALIAGGLGLPVIGPGKTVNTAADTESNEPLSASEPAPFTEQLITLSGIDPEVLEAGSIAMASYDDLSTAGTFLATPAVFTADETDGHDHDGHDHADEPTTQPENLEPAIATRSIDTKPFTLVGISSDQPIDESARILVRVEEESGWSEWTPLPVSGHLPDGEEAEGIRYGTEPLLTDTATGVEVRIDTPEGDLAADPQLVLIDNPVLARDARLPDPDPSPQSGPLASAVASTVSAPQPNIITRAQWGANESLRRAGAKYAPTIKAAFVHHTVSKSNYSPDEAAAQVRNLYTYFTKGLKYSDMAYNFMVDRFGRLYEGRGGGMDKAVVGGHTAGFNDQTFAVSAVGNFQTFKPQDPEMAAIIDSVSSLLAWKLSMNHRDPNGQTQLVSDSGAGTSKYKPGQVATAAVVGGHGDIGATSCPGKYLEQQLPAIRAATGAKMGASMINPAASSAKWGDQNPVRINAITNAPLQFNVSVRSQCGDVVRTLSGAQGQAGQLGIDWDKRDDAGAPVPPGTYTLTMNSNGNGEALYPWIGQARVLATADSPPDPCAPPDSFTLTGAGYGHGVGLSQWGARTMAAAGIDAATIATYYYQGTTVTPVQDDMEISVNIEHQKSRIDLKSDSLGGSGGGVEVSVGGAVVSGSPSDEFQFQRSNGQVKVVKISGGASSVVGVGPSATARPAADTSLHVVNKGGKFSAPGNRFRYGYIEVTPVKSGRSFKLNAVNKVRLHDEYLYGIAEVPSSWPDAALQAQVLAARTYALSKINDGIRASCNCHLDDGYGPFSDQTYVGDSKAAGPQGDRWVAAVNATHASPSTGLAILSNGQPIKAFYSASNGGASQASADVWGGNLSYAVSVADPYSLDPSNPDSSWSKSVSQADVAKAFGATGVWSLAVTERFTSGAAKTVAATLADGSAITKSGSQIRSALGLKSSFINAIDGNAGVPVTAPGAPAIAPAPAPAPAPIAGERQVALLTASTTDQPAGSAFTVKARVTPGKKGLRTWLQQQVNGEWKTVAKKKTKKKGRVTFKVKDAWPPSSTQVFRVVTTKKKNIVGASAELSIGVVPSVKARTVSLTSPEAVTVKAGKPITIKAKIRPGKKGLVVWRQALVSGDAATGEWRTVQKSKTTRGGKVSFTIKKAKPAGANYTYRLLVVDKRQAAGVSPIISVSVS